MWHLRIVTVLTYFLQLLTLINADQSPLLCKASLGSPDWPSVSAWTKLNDSISGRLLQPPPPGAVCHLGQPTYNNATCPIVQAEWYTAVFHQANPISNYWNNWNNNSCLPTTPTGPCSGKGYPVYVVNATCKEDVKKGVDFARENNVRLVVKATGHDYIGRSVAPNSLSIWTHHMTGIHVHDASFKPRGCDYSIDTAAITVAAGEQYGTINLAASLKNLTVLSAGERYVGIGGHVTGGGHAALSPTYGLAADNVLEMELVTPGGDILTANECQNQDLFWAMRGGGGSTFGVITSITIKAFPSTPWNVAIVSALTYPNTDTFWSAMAYILSQYPTLAAQGIGGYTTLTPNTTIDGFQAGQFSGAFGIPVLSSSNTSTSLAGAVEQIFSHLNATYPNEFIFSINASTYPDFYSWWLPTNSPDYAGYDLLVGSWLLPEESLTANLTALKIALQNSMPPDGGGNAYLVSGKGVWDVVPRGGSDAVNPAWRKALIHFTLGASWSPYDEAEELEQTNLLTNTYVEALRMLAPESGAYINEADAFEPNFQQTFWGSNYPRLKDIKRRFDPEDVLWCTPCVGNERWKEVGDQLCHV